MKHWLVASKRSFGSLNVLQDYRLHNFIAELKSMRMIYLNGLMGIKDHQLTIGIKVCCLRSSPIVFVAVLLSTWIRWTTTTFFSYRKESDMSLGGRSRAPSMSFLR